MAANDHSNELQVSVNGDGCGVSTTSSSNINRACVSITLCEHGTSNCQTIDNILLDTGSVGLRLDRSLVTVATKPVMVGGGSLSECNVLTHNSMMAWGPVVTADVKLGGEPAVTMPLQLLDPTAQPQSACVLAATMIPYQGQAGSGVNGYLGLGMQAHDCGAPCAAAASAAYLTCTGSSCQAAAVPLPSQMTNPVTLLPIDNNGFLVQLPAVPAAGAASASGQLILGVGTRANNLPSGITVLPGNGEALISSSLNGSGSPQLTAVDTGVPYYWLPTFGNISVCADHLYCPTSPVTVSATLTGASGSASKTVAIAIGNGDALYQSLFNVFGNYAAVLTAPVGSESVVLGLPFLYGKSVFFALPGATTSVGNGPYIGL